MITYYQNGTLQDRELILDSVDYFYIQHVVVDDVDKYCYNGDEIYKRLQNEIIALHDKFRDLYFPDVDAYYEELKIIPEMIINGGLDSDNCISKTDFIKIKDKYMRYIPNINKHLYVKDCQYLVCTIQNLIESLEFCFINYFICLSQIDLFIDYSKKSDEFCLSSNKARQISFVLETFFTKAYSILDIICKIIYEFKNPVSESNFEKYKKLISAEKLWGDRKKLKIDHKVNTIFEECTLIKLIESLRNEAVHNGSWEFNPKVYCKLNDGIITERYMFFPDFDQGRLNSINTRKHFFSNNTKVNEILPDIFIEYLTRICNTIMYIKSAY